MKKMSIFASLVLTAFVIGSGITYIPQPIPQDPTAIHYAPQPIPQENL